MVVKISIERVFDNPFQVRQGYADIEELAESILKMKAARPETGGLMQTPTARVVKPNGTMGWNVLDPADYGFKPDDGTPCVLEDEPECLVQLAFGHRRLRAFHWLAERDADYGLFPVNLFPLSDKQMSDLAWEENSKRKDLTAIEEALALQGAIATFGYSQEEIGRRWGLSQSAVANKLRLLQLPAAAQEAIRGGQLTERHGRALLAALNKSGAIYELAAREIVPLPPVAEEVETAAKEFVAAHAGSHHIYVTHVLPPEISCAVCGRPIKNQAFTVNGLFEDYKKPYLCTACYRVGSDWSPPSTGEAEKLISDIVARNNRTLDHTKFPLDQDFSLLPDGLWQGTRDICTVCEARDEQRCFDKGCYEMKSQAWFEHQVGELKGRLQRDYGIEPEKVVINQSYSGHDLHSDTVDPELVAPGGPCAPGKCQRVQFKYADWDSDRNVKPYDDLPFIFQCNHTGAHIAAQRRYLEAQKPEEEKTEAVQQAEAIQQRKERSRQIYRQAVASVAAALTGGKAQAWQAVADALNLREAGETVEEIWGVIAEKLLEDKKYYLSSKYMDSFWQDDKAVANYEKIIGGQLSKWGVARLSGIEETSYKLEKILDFVRGRRIKGEITMEQIEGNRVNVEKLVGQVRGLHQSGLIQEKGELTPILNLVREVMDELWEAAGEIEQPLPQEWGISLEMSLAELVVGE